jgi:hypothetical protein
VLSAGSLGSQKQVYARKQTLKNLEDVFADRLWPNLASYNKNDPHVMLVYTPCVIFLVSTDYLPFSY